LKPLGEFEVWFLTGSQDLYGDDVLRQVAENSKAIAAGLDGSESIPVNIVWKPVVKNPEAILAACVEASSSDKCVGVITWCHTFSPAKMWIAGLQALTKPLLHLHTQFNRDLPWTEIDMDFMNLNQAAHGDREFAHIEARLGLARKTVAGHWQEASVQQRVGTWTRAACGLWEAKHLRVARFGDNMRNVAVTEGDKVSYQMAFGVAVNGFSVSDLGDAVLAVPIARVNELVAEYEKTYSVVPSLLAGGKDRESMLEAARIEIALRDFMVAGGFGALTDTFENLDGLKQLPGIAAQRLQAEGYGFGPEGDWKTAAMVRIVKVMSKGLPGGTSLMEDYTYHLDPKDQKILGAHMLEVCPTISDKKPNVEIHPLGIGGKADPVRLVFDAGTGPALVVNIMDMGDRFRILANEIDLVPPNKAMDKLPVGRAVWKPRPSLSTSAECWLTAGGSHHTCLTRAVDIEAITDFAEMTGVELLVIGADTTVSGFKKEVRWNEAYYHLARGLR
jgi:L-arabinose isomerase